MEEKKKKKESTKTKFIRVYKGNYRGFWQNKDGKMNKE